MGSPLTRIHQGIYRKTTNKKAASSSNPVFNTYPMTISLLLNVQQKATLR